MALPRRVDGRLRVSRPLDGLLVADFSRVLAGPLATMHLADLGATVVKVERPGVGDDTRAWGPPWTRAVVGVLRVREPQQVQARPRPRRPGRPGARPASWHGARTCSSRTSGRAPSAAYGLDYASVAAVNPALVYCSISGFGDGAGARPPGYDFLVQAVGGLMSITGAADGEPTKVGVALVDVLTGKDAVIGILAALAARAGTGRGDHVRVDLLSSLLGGLVNQAANYLATGVAPGRMGNRHPSIAPYETLRCADGAARGRLRQRPAVRAAGRGDRPARPRSGRARFATNAARVGHRAELVDQLEGSLRRACG